MPCIAIAYDLKLTAFFDQFGLGSYCVQWNEVNSDRLTQLVRQLVAERDSSALAIMGTAASSVHRQRQFIHQALR